MGGKISSDKVTDVRSQLGPLAELAEKMNVAFSIVTHPPKNTSPQAINHFIGSQAFIAAARIGHLCIPEVVEGQETGRVLFADAKRNIGSKMPTLAFRQQTFTMEQGIVAPFVKWEDGPVDITADQAIAATMPSKDRPTEAMKFLNEILPHGEPVSKKKIDEEAAKRGLSQDQLDRAKRRLGNIEATKDGLTGWTWTMKL
jgi:hypothetical protein